MMRGINKDKIFIESRNKKFAEELMGTLFKEREVQIISYCIMDNHLHLILKGELEDISFALKKINTRFAMRINKELKRVGHVFQDRFKSEVIHNDQHLLQAIRYVHNNPKKAKMISNQKDYPWSSYRSYIGSDKGILDKDIIEEILEIAGGLRSFTGFHETLDFAEFLDTDEEVENNRLEHAQSIIKDYCVDSGIVEIGRGNQPDHIDELVAILLRESKLSHRKIAGLLEISNNVVHSISKKL
jgi:REP element-mobilizing transposase RayT